MRKEVVIVILVGILIGAIVAYGIYTAQSALKQRELKSQEILPKDNQEKTSPSSHTLSINEPQDESIWDQEKINVNGTTTPKSVVTILTEENEYLLSADSEGYFNAEVGLTGGANTITVSSFDEQGNRAQQSVVVVYSTEL
ncbi:MAG: hypothetical protein A3A65_06590 [Candidatus Chisholmbacteria bacterium RIFCSPLOWO2_01_FULL_49_14]|uniref:Bacterial Ig domain-containing protein n=1 Tax=Candidatus Chisholmbacteria bacterium RIFCSPLOWO2_01_FULL_49_14 TaxID=1797593 RepID=A0A1G1W1A9_9BACT|nr:MAG: hypothetical protein A3A65_06590 [Candidatus Chisholmbacteria bacterium RIFCSPLOWO2_01_FULL_49_14]